MNHIPLIYMYGPIFYSLLCKTPSGSVIDPKSLSHGLSGHEKCLMFPIVARVISSPTVATKISAYLCNSHS